MHSGESFCIRAKDVCQLSARHDSDLAFPSRGRCRRSRRMRCSAPARLCRQMLHFASLTEILSLRYRLSVFLSRRKKNSEKERPLRGFRREVSPDLLRRTEMKSKAGAQCGSAPRDPPGTGKPGETNNRDVVHSGESFCVRAKAVCQLSARHDSDLAFPSRGRCRRSRRMRCSAPARLCRQMLHFASLTEILSLRYRLSVFLSRRKKNSEKERPLRGLRREVSPDLLRRTEMKSKAGAQCGSAP